MYRGYLTDVEGIKVGHASDFNALTGCTVIYSDKAMTGGVDVRGSAPGTRETDIFDSKKTVSDVNAVLLSGGSAFGLEAASGVMQYLEERNLGVDVGVTKVPIVPGAVIFDLNIGDYKVRPNKDMGYKAIKNANELESRQGSIGAGTGATVGKLLGSEYTMKGGLGSSSVKAGDIIVSSLIVVNAVGDIFDYERNKKIAGPYDINDRKFLDTYNYLKKDRIKNIDRHKNKNTTIGVVCTNAKLKKFEANKVAEVAHNGYAKSINPVHTSMDGDTIFVLSTNEVDANIDLVSTMAQETVYKSIANSIYSSDGFGKLITYKDIIND